MENQNWTKDKIELQHLHCDLEPERSVLTPVFRIKTGWFTRGKTCGPYQFFKRKILTESQEFPPPPPNPTPSELNPVWLAIGT